MDKLWRPVALGKLGELKQRASEIKSADEIFSAIDGLEIPDDLKKNIQEQIMSKGVNLAPAFTGWAQFSPGNAIDFAIRKIRNYKEKE